MLYSFLRNELYYPIGQLYSPSVSYIFASQKFRKAYALLCFALFKMPTAGPETFPDGKYITDAKHQYHCEAISLFAKQKISLQKQGFCLISVFLDKVSFKNVAFLDVVVFIKTDTAFVACHNFLSIVLFTLKRSNGVLSDYDTVTYNSYLAVS